jgi:ABC-type nitrate/sulfonate/bicarbonate transport system substrate-binding protein
MKTSHKFTIALVILTVIAAAIIWQLRGPPNPATSAAPSAPATPVFKVAIAPYQDMAMLMNAKPLGLDKKNGIDLQTPSMAWENLTPAVASATPSVDVAFASLVQFITQEHSLNAGSSDPIVFFYPAYVFRGGAFVTFNKDVSELTKADLNNPDKIRQFLSYRFAAQKTSSYEMLLSILARKVGTSLKDLKVVDMDAGDGLLAAENNSVDMSSAGLTQRNEAVRRGGRVVLTMDDMGQVDIAGFIAKKSTVETKRKEIIGFLNTWADCCTYTLSNLNTNSEHPLAYLRKNSSTQYTPEEFATALSQELLPNSVADLQTNVVDAGSRYYYGTIVSNTVAYYMETKALTVPPQNIQMLNLP